MLLRQLASTVQCLRAITTTTFSPLSGGTLTLALRRQTVGLATPSGLLHKMSTAARRSSPVSTAVSLDHLVLTVRDLDATVQFYEDVLGMKHSEFTSPSSPTVQRHALSFGPQKINLHLAGKEFEPKAQNVMPGSADLCFLVEENVDEVVKRLGETSVRVLEGGGVVERTGARGKLRSVYVRDPDGNLVELSNMM